jgi:hypothetical protein
MTTPTITLYPDTLPAKGQANAAFDTNVDNFLTWQTVTNGPELAAMITWTQGVADTVLATALAGDLPALTGKAGNYIRANAAENGGEFRTTSQVLSDIGATAALALKAPLANPPLTGNPTAPTQTAGNDSTRISTTGFVQTAVSFKTPYTSPEQTITAGGALTLAHGLGAVPDLIQARLVCKTAEDGYSIGDETIVNNQTNAAANQSLGQSIVSDATNLNIRFGATSGVYQLLNKSTGAVATITAANWRLVVKAWKLE